MKTSRSLVQMMIVFAILTAASAAMAFTLDPQSAGQLSHLVNHPRYDLNENQTAPSAPTTRTYESAQGKIDLEKMESLISKNLGFTPITVESIRWPYSPLPYSNYFVGKAMRKLIGSDDLVFATYVLKMKIAGTHEAVCELTLRPFTGEGVLWNCSSPTAKIRVYIEFYFEDVGIPVDRTVVIPQRKARPQ